MRSIARILAVALLGLGATSCAGGSTTSRGSATVARQTGSASTTAAPNFSTHNNDRDNDGDHNDDDGKVLYYGHAASPSDRRASVALVTRYFAVAAAENGAAACSMLVPFIAEAVAEQDGKSPPLLGKTCAVVMSKLFRLHHRLLALKHATLRVIEVRVEGHKALAVLDFPTIPEVRQFVERRVGRTWKLQELLDGILE
jgi:hypothetical protein